MTPRALILPARAKINHFLSVGPKRVDGYHAIDTLFQEISLEDSLRLRLSSDPAAFVLEGRSVPLGRNNLVWRALETLRKRMKARGNFQVYLKKNIPVGAGLGGGSSDAAAALLGGWWLLKNKPGRPRRRKAPAFLFDMASKLGADVPFFLMGKAARAQGIGEVLTRVPDAGSQWLVLVYPRVAVSTPKAYGWLDQDAARRDQVGFSAPWNDFERVVYPRFPKITKGVAALTRLGGRSVRLSGSGSSFFGFVSHPKEGERIRKKFPPGFDVFVVKTLG